MSLLLSASGKAVLKNQADRQSQRYTTLSLWHASPVKKILIVCCRKLDCQQAAFAVLTRANPSVHLDLRSRAAASTIIIAAMRHEGRGFNSSDCRMHDLQRNAAGSHGCECAHGGVLWQDAATGLRLCSCQNKRDNTEMTKQIHLPPLRTSNAESAD